MLSESLSASKGLQLPPTPNPCAPGEGLEVAAGAPNAKAEGNGARGLGIRGALEAIVRGQDSEKSDKCLVLLKR